MKGEEGGGADEGMEAWVEMRPSLKPPSVPARNTQVNFSPDGHFVMSGDAEGRCWFWDWKTCKARVCLLIGEVALLCFLPSFFLSSATASPQCTSHRALLRLLHPHFLLAANSPRQTQQKVYRTIKAHEGVCIGCEWNPIETSKVRGST